MASRSDRLFPTIAGAVVMESRVHCRLGRTVHWLRLRRRGRMAALVPSAAWARWNRWARSASSSWRARAIASRTRGGDAAEGTAFELGVVLNAHPGEGGDLAAPQPGDAALPCLRYLGLLGSDLGAPRGEELADFGSVVHVNDGTAGCR